MSTTTNQANAFSHFDQAGNAHMIDVGDKPDTKREAVAAGAITLSPETYNMVREGTMTKGDVLGVARIAGIMAAKKVADIIPLAHPLPISKVEINFNFNPEKTTIEIVAKTAITGKTGVEMEALTAVSVTALTIYDMCKAVDKNMVIDNIHLISKSGGKSGTFKKKELNK
ncbi:MAG: cyclic pyranopterin monophosphate synthase MoaC [Proteobacteria bacterium]|nr:cyclic pyranopterin monophosphate synthase MoaC [Pseudomonadota bacterium]MBU1716996.1 cyclic pyranopterin monophosphate synthase MoaC [Pseudomonadota bacterium]